MKDVKVYIPNTDDMDTLHHLVAIRTRRENHHEVSMFLVDPQCLGVRDAFYDVMDDVELEERLDGIRDYLDMEHSQSAAWGRKYLEAAVEYARKIGFSPCKDFKKGMRVFGGVKSKDCAEEFTFGGEDGKPLYVPLNADDDKTQDRILKQLTVRLGEDGFSYMKIYDDEVFEPGDYAALQSNEILKNTDIEDIDDVYKSIDRVEDLAHKEGIGVADVHAILGSLYFYARNYDLSIEVLKHAISLDEENPNLWIQLAKTYCVVKQSKADECLRKAEACLKKQSAEFSEENCQIMEAQIKELFGFINTMAEEHGLDYETNLKVSDLFEEANDKMDIDNFDDAKDLFIQILETAPNFYKAYGALSHIALRHDKDIEKAQEYNAKALVIKPEYSIALQNQKVINSVIEGKTDIEKIGFEWDYE